MIDTYDHLIYILSLRPEEIVSSLIKYSLLTLRMQVNALLLRAMTVVSMQVWSGRIENIKVLSRLC